MSDELILNKLSEFFNPLLDCSFGPAFGPSSLNSVIEAEMELKVTFPASYKLFLLRYGAANCGLHEIYGVFDKSCESRMGYLSVVEQTLSMRGTTQRTPIYAENCIFFAHDYVGNIFWLDYTQAQGDFVPVYGNFVLHGTTIVANDFLEFLCKIYYSDVDLPFYK